MKQGLNQFCSGRDASFPEHDALEAQTPASYHLRVQKSYRPRRGTAEATSRRDYFGMKLTPAVSTACRLFLTLKLPYIYSSTY